MVQTVKKPNQVIDAISQFYQQTNSNVHRGAHKLAGEATDMYEDARETVKKYINAENQRRSFFYVALRKPLILSLIAMDATV